MSIPNHHPGRISAAWALLAMSLLAGPMAIHAAAQRSEPNARPAAQPVPISTAINELRREGRKSWMKKQSFPREESNYASEKHFTTDNRKLIHALSTRLSTNTAIDAYIRWQLLSFDPDFKGLNPKAIEKLAIALPPLRNLDGFLPGFDPTISTVNDGAVLDVTAIVSADRRYVTMTTRASQASVVQIRQAPVTSGVAPVIVAAANQAALNFRDELIDRLPPARGGQAMVMLQDVIDRNAAADTSTTERFHQFAAATRNLPSDPTVSDQIRRQLRDKLAQLEKHPAPKRSAKVDDPDDREALGEHKLTRLDPDDIAAARKNLSDQAQSAVYRITEKAPARP